MTPPRLPHKLLLLGTTLFIVGGSVLLGNLGEFSTVRALWPITFVVLGLFILYLVYIQGVSERYIFPGMFCTLGGVFFLLLNTVISETDMARIWPIFMTIAGVSIVPYGYKKRGNKRIALLIPSFAIIGLSFLFLPFSLNIAGITFMKFVILFWPIVLMIMGVVLVVVNFMKNKKDTQREG